MAWHISQNEEAGFYGSFSTKEEAIAEGKAAGYDVFFVGEERPPASLSSGIFADAIIDNAIEGSLEEDWCLEFARFEPTQEQLADLQQHLRTAVDQWVERHSLQPQWFLVDDIEKVVFEDEQHGIAR